MERPRRELFQLWRQFRVISLLNYFEILGDVETAESAWMKEWDSDLEFGRQALNGMNPSCIHRWGKVQKFGKKISLDMCFLN